MWKCSGSRRMKNAPCSVLICRPTAEENRSLPRSRFGMVTKFTFSQLLLTTRTRSICKDTSCVPGSIHITTESSSRTSLLRIKIYYRSMPRTYRTSGQASLRDAVFLAGGLTPDASVDGAQLFRLNPDGSSKIFSVNLREALNGTSADNILLQPRDRLLIHRSALSVDASTVEITGDVAKPGRYPYAGNMRAEDLIRASGGLKRSADTNSADLTRYAATGGPAQQFKISLASILNGNPTEDVPLRGGDVLAIRQVWA